MRILFADPDSASEQQALQRLDAQIASWWTAFMDKQSVIQQVFRQQTEFDLVAFMERHLSSIDKQLMWEFGPPRAAGKHRLVITPEGDRQLRPLVSRILAAAPKGSDFEFYGARPPEDVEMARQTVQARTGGNIEDALATLHVESQGLLELHLYGSFAEAGDSAFATAVVAFESLLGESLMERFVGTVELSALPRAGLLRRKTTTPAGAIPLAELHSRVQAAVQGMRADLPERACVERVEEWGWGTARVQAPAQSEVALPGQADLLVAVIGHRELFDATHSARDFDSERFSKLGEIFCYLKIDGSEGLDASSFADRGEIEDALNEALSAKGQGACIGGGTGSLHSYVELALSDLDGTLSVVVQTLRTAKVPLRSWLLFHDAELAAEWIGVHPESPPPPGF